MMLANILRAILAMIVSMAAAVGALPSPTPAPVRELLATGQVGPAVESISGYPGPATPSAPPPPEGYAAPPALLPTSTSTPTLMPVTDTPYPDPEPKPTLEPADP